MRIACLSLGFCRVRKSAERLCNPCILGSPEEEGTKSELATSPVPSRGPESGRNGYVMAFFRPPRTQKTGENQKWLHHLCLLGGLKVGGMVT